MKKRPRLALAALATAAALAGTCLAATGSLAAVSRPGRAAARATLTAGARDHRCYFGELSAGLHPQQPRTQQYGFILTLTNVSGAPCSLYGYPGLGLQNARHMVLHSRTFWGRTYFDRDPGRHLIVLSPGETASADVAWSQGQARGAGGRAAYLEVTPPNDYRHFVLRIPFGPHAILHGHLHATAMARHTAFF